MTESVRKYFHETNRGPSIQGQPFTIWLPSAQAAWVRSQPDSDRAIASLISQRINRETKGETRSVLHMPKIPKGPQSDVERRQEKRQAIEANGKRILAIRAKRKSDKPALGKAAISPAAIANNVFMQIGSHPKWAFEREGTVHVCLLTFKGRQWEGRASTKKLAKQDVCKAFLEYFNPDKVV